MARVTKADKLQRQLDKIRKDCKHPKPRLEIIIITPAGLIRAYCHGCAQEIQLDPCLYCKKCLTKTMRPTGESFDDIVNSCIRVEYTCKKCGSKYTDEV